METSDVLDARLNRQIGISLVGWRQEGSLCYYQFGFGSNGNVRPSRCARDYQHGREEVQQC